MMSVAKSTAIIAAYLFATSFAMMPAEGAVQAVADAKPVVVRDKHDLASQVVAQLQIKQPKPQSPRPPDAGGAIAKDQALNQRRPDNPKRLTATEREREAARERALNQRRPDNPKRLTAAEKERGAARERALNQRPLDNPKRLTAAEQERGAAREQALNQRRPNDLRRQQLDAREQAMNRRRPDGPLR